MTRRTVCIVDDDGAVRESLRMLLERRGFTVRCYASAQIFLSQAKLDDCGCLLIDQRMPGLSGVALLENLRDRGACVPAIMVTGDSDPLLTGRAQSAGAIVVLHKPMVSSELLGWIELAFGRSAAGISGASGQVPETIEPPAP